METTNKKRLVSIVNGFTNAAVLVVGDLILDHFINGKVSRVSPEAPVPVVDVKHERFALGGCANVIANITAAGGRVWGTGVIGDDAMGEKLLAQLTNGGISRDGVLVEENRRTTVKSRIIASGQQIARLDYEDLHDASAASINEALAYIATVLPTVRALIISDYGKGFVGEELLNGIRKMTAGKGIFVCVDPKKSNFDFYAGFDIITPNTAEALAAAGVNPREKYDIVNVGEVLLKRHDIASLLVTRSEEGMSLFERGTPIRHTHFSTQAREVFDVTGAGDTVIAILALSVAAGASLKEAIMLANLSAGIVVGKAGPAAVSAQEILSAI